MNLSDFSSVAFLTNCFKTATGLEVLVSFQEESGFFSGSLEELPFCPQEAREANKVRLRINNLDFIWVTPGK
jgi:hypothetical protein